MYTVVQGFKFNIYHSCWTNLAQISVNYRHVGPDDNTLPEGWGEMQYEDGSR